MNKTERDAFLRVLDGRIGSLAENPSEEYLIALRKYLHMWIDDVDKKLISVWGKQALNEEEAQ